MVLHTGLLREGDEELDFGTFLKLVRTNTRVKQGTIAALLADKGWTPTTYTRLENGQIAPRFDDLLPLYRAFGLAGVSFSLADRQCFVERARKKIEGKKTHREQRSDAEWAQLRYELARLDGLPEASLSPPVPVLVPQKTPAGGHRPPDWTRDLARRCAGLFPGSGTHQGRGHPGAGRHRQVERTELAGEPLLSPDPDHAPRHPL
jgi:hypothetical protein